MSDLIKYNKKKNHSDFVQVIKNEHCTNMYQQNKILFDVHSGSQYPLCETLFMCPDIHCCQKQRSRELLDNMLLESLINDDFLISSIISSRPI